MLNPSACLHPSALHCQCKGPARNAAAAAPTAPCRPRSARCGSGEAAGPAGPGRAGESEGSGSTARAGSDRAWNSEESGGTTRAGSDRAWNSEGSGGTARAGLGPSRSLAGTLRAEGFQPLKGRALSPHHEGRPSRRVPPQPLAALKGVIGAPRVSTVTLRVKRPLGNKIYCRNRKST